MASPQYTQTVQLLQSYLRALGGDPTTGSAPQVQSLELAPLLHLPQLSADGATADAYNRARNSLNTATDALSGADSDTLAHLATASDTINVYRHNLTEIYNRYLETAGPLSELPQDPATVAQLEALSADAVNRGTTAMGNASEWITTHTQQLHDSAAWQAYRDNPPTPGSPAHGRLANEYSNTITQVSVSDRAPGVTVKPDAAVLEAASIPYPPNHVVDAINKSMDHAGITDPEARTRWMNGYTTLIWRESSNDSAAYNDWDVNAQRGDPSQGLAQTILSTFATYHDPNTSPSITDPVANITASMRYVMDPTGYGVARDGSDLAAKIAQANPNQAPHGY